jgi:uncharacterized protein (DUF58 family)
MKFQKSGQKDSSFPRHWFQQTTAWKFWNLSRVIPLRWMLPITLVAIPMIILFVLTLFLFLSLIFLFGVVSHLVSLKPYLQSRRCDEVIEAEYWIEPENKP